MSNEKKLEINPIIYGNTNLSVWIGFRGVFEIEGEFFEIS